MNSSAWPVIHLSDERGHAGHPVASVAYVGGPYDGLRREQPDLPDSIDANGGTYRRSVRCADDGVLRYVFAPEDDGTDAP